MIIGTNRVSLRIAGRWTGDSTHPYSMGTFDLILRSDLLYERKHAADLSKFIDQHSKTHCDVIIIDPGRGQSSRFSKKMTNFGYGKCKAQINSAFLKEGGSENILHYHR